MGDEAADPKALVTIDDDGRRAVLVLPAGMSTDDLVVDAVHEAVRSSGVAVDAEVEARIQVALELHERLIVAPDAGDRRVEVLIAEITAPVDGADGWLEWNDGFDPTMRCDVEAGGTDRVDHYSRIRYIRVEERAHVATVHAPTMGTDGRALDGTPIHATAGNAHSVRTDASVRLGSDGRITALGPGVLRYEDGQIRVSRLFELAGWVDFASGNIDFDGTVIIGQGVRDRFTVKTTEHLAVHGVVGAAVVRCGGEFSCAGMAGRGRGVLDVRGPTACGYLNAVKFDLRGDVSLAREMIGCRGLIGGNLYADTAALIGGEVAVVGSAELRELGSTAHRATTLLLGADAARRRVERMRARIEEQLAGRREESTRLGCSARERARCRAVRDEINELEIRLAVWSDVSSRLAEAVERSSLSDEATLVVSGVIHPHVRLVLGDFEFSVRETLRGPLTIRWRGLEQPEIRIAGGAAEPLADRFAA